MQLFNSISNDNRESKTQIRLEQLDGLKGLACLIIIASHTAAFGMHGQGSIWADFFFVLSGFFCVFPWTKDGEEKISSPKFFLYFYIKRIARIIPAYWLCILFFNWINGTLFNNKREIARSLFLIQTSGHNWYVQHLMVGYLCVPFLMVLIYILKNKLHFNNIIVAVLLTYGAFILSKHLLFSSKLYLLWNGGNHRHLYSGLVILGMGVGYIYKSININFNKTAYIILDFLELSLILIMTVFTSHKFLTRLGIDYIFGWKHPDICGIFGALLILIAAINNKGLMSKAIGNRLLVFIGKISLEVYLIHYYLLSYFDLMAGKKFFIIVILSVPVSYMMHKYINEKIYKWVKVGKRFKTKNISQYVNSTHQD